MVAVETQLVTTAESPASLLHLTNAFHWRQIESTNYEDYVANLRAVHFTLKIFKIRSN